MTNKMTNREKAIVIINVLNKRTLGKESDVIKTEILCAAKEAFNLGISYFEFASIAADAWFEGNKRMELLSKKVREVVEKMEANRREKEMTIKTTSGKMSSNDLVRRNMNALNEFNRQNEINRIHNMMNGF